MGRIRDNQRSKVYKAENSCKWYRVPCSKEELYEMIHLVMEMEAPDKEYEICHTRRGGAWCRAGRELNFYDMSIGIALHEISHLLNWGEEAHGPRFCVTFLRLVREYMGEMYYEQLMQAMDDNGVIYGDYETSIKNPQRKAAKQSWLTDRGDEWSIPVSKCQYPALKWSVGYMKNENPNYPARLTKSRLYIRKGLDEWDFNQLIITIKEGFECSETDRGFLAGMEYADRIKWEIENAS